MTRDSRAVSTTSLVTLRRLLSLQDAFDLGAEAVDQTKIAAGDANDRGNRLSSLLRML
jgi:hypothetical protein